MDKSELLSAFESRVAQFERYQGFIERAQGHASRFAPAVVEKVVQDNEQKSLEVVLELIPLTSDMDEVVAELTRDRDAVLAGVQDSRFALEELELRREIGDIEEDAFAQEAGPHQRAVDSVGARVSEFEESLGRFRSVLDRWTDLGTRAGVLQEQPAASDSGSGNSGSDDGGSIDDGSNGVEMHDAPDDAADDRSNLVDELDVEYDPDPPGATPAAAPRIKVQRAPSASVGGLEAVQTEDRGGEGFEVGDLDILGEDEDLELEGGEAAAAPKDDEKSDKPRRAVLLYQEGTPEEQIYPFNGDVMSLGRGRDNDVQVKNDSKVSRYHCKLYRRGPNFYIEDNKSANGSLVNGELITERRLFGGEEVIIGETFFRFRILD